MKRWKWMEKESFLPNWVELSYSLGHTLWVIPSLEYIINLHIFPTAALSAHAIISGNKVTALLFSEHYIFQPGY